MLDVGMITSNIARIFGTSKAEVRSVIGVGSRSEMTPKWRPGLIGITAIAMANGLTQHAPAAPITWIGGNANWDASNANWNPADEPDSNDEAIFNTPNDVNMTNATDTIIGLTISGGIDLNTNSVDLTVDGLVQLTGASTNLLVGGATSLLTADSVAINTGGTIRMTGGSLTVVEETGNGTFNINSGGTLSGNGVINLNDAVVAGTILMTLSDGTLTATSTATGDLFGSSAATLTINVSDADARIDLDNVTPVVSVSRNDTLDINGIAHGASDPFSGTLNLAEGSTFDMSAAWQTDAGGTINANTVGILVGSEGTPATIAGAAFTFAGGTINLDDIDSLRFSAPLTATAGTIANAGHIIFDAATTVGVGTDFQMTGSLASITVEPGVVVNIDDANFNADGTGAATNVITINSGGILDIDLNDAAADDSIGSTINLNGGELDVTNVDNAWSINRGVNVGATTGTSQINGDEVTFTNTTITVGASSTLDINAPGIWAATGNLVVNAGAVARIDGTSVFNTPGTFTGTGSLRIGGTATFTTATTINMPSGTVDLDGADTVGNTVTVNANTTIDVGTMASFGNSNIVGTNILELNNFANLTVNITDPATEWTLNSTGVLDINAPANPFAGAGIQGSDFNMNGIANISGNSIWNARTDISGTANVAAAGSLNLRGGTLVDTNRLIGGNINGPGAVQALTNDALVGFGTIGAEVAFADNSELRADDGILNVGGLITDVGVIGTADVDGILNVTAVWNTNVAGLVDLKGGELRGAPVTTGTGGINGFGLVSARVINTTYIQAENGDLVLQTAANDNDWDGAGLGDLEAISGNLEIRDNASFAFTGDVFVNNGRQVHANGFELDFNPGSTLTLRNGTYRCTNSTDFGGQMTVILAGQSILQITGTANFENASLTTLNDNLRLNNTLTAVQVGADFTGSGALINPATRTLRLLDGVVSTDFNVLVQNEGILQLGTAGTDAQVAAADYQQTTTGSLQIELGGVALNAFDRLNLTGTAALAGGLNVTLIGGYVPAVGNTFNIVTATGGISGTFNAFSQPAGMPAGLALKINYSAFIVQLEVVALTPFEIWINSFASITNPADRLKGANPDNDGLNNQAEFALDGNPASGTATGKVVGKIAPVAGVNALTLTLPVRTGAILDPADPAGGDLGLIKAADAVSYRIQASDQLTNWNLTVTEVTGADATAIQLGLPALNVGWSYRSFRSPGAVAGDPVEFMRIFLGE